MPTSPSEPRWLTGREVSELNRYEVEETGEPFLVLQPQLLSGAVERPRNLWRYEDEVDIILLATRLLFAIAGAHAFQQGNKRTAWAACGWFLRLNGFRLVAPDTSDFADRIVDVIERTLAESDFAELLRPFVVPLDEAQGP